MSSTGIGHDNPVPAAPTDTVMVPLIQTLGSLLVYLTLYVLALACIRLFQNCGGHLTDHVLEGQQGACLCNGIGSA